MSLSSDIVLRLRDEYSAGSMYGASCLSAHAQNTINNNGFMGSLNVVFLSTNDSIVHESPACIAAPLVNMVAKNAISMGIAGQGSQPVPVRLFVTNELTITTKHLSIGDVMLLTKPKNALLSCSKLTLSKSTDEEPDHFEVVKSWSINDDMEVEVVTRG